MSASHAAWYPDAPRRRWPDAAGIARGLRAAAPALLFGLRLWAAVCLALYVTFWLQLDNGYWAGTSAAIVSQPSLGASLRKGWFRMVGTVIGGLAIVSLTACFPQQRVGFLLGLALWGAVCAAASTLLRNFAAYGAALAGYTAAIIAGDELGAVGGANGQAFTLAITRVSEMWIGIICAGVVLAATDFGGTRRRLATQFAAIAAAVAAGLARGFAPDGPGEQQSRPARRDLIGRVVALDPVIDAAIGEASELRPRAPAFQAAVGGLFTALSGWRTVALYRELLPAGQESGEADRAEVELVRRILPPADASGWLADPWGTRQACTAAVRALAALPARTVSLRMLADRAADALLGIRHALDAVVLLVDPAHALRRSGPTVLHVPDLLPALVNAARAFLTIAAVALFWIVTAWPNGATAIVFAAVAVILFAPRAEQAYGIAISFMLGTTMAAILAATVEFAVLPRLVSFAGFSLALGLVLVPGGAMIAQPWRTLMFTAMTVNFLPLLAPANQMTYDTQQFYNGALAIVGGIGAGTLAFLLLPPLSPARRTRRLLALTLRDLRRLATGPIPRAASDWESGIYSRLSAMPAQAEPLQFAQLLAALSVGSGIIRLRRFARRLGQDADLDAAMAAIGRGDIAAAIAHFEAVRRHFAAAPDGSPAAAVGLRARGSIRALREALSHHSAYFAGATTP